MENTLKLVGRTSNEIFTLRYPYTLMEFCEFDFSYYAGGAIEVCNEALKTGTPDFDKISEIKKDIQSAHCFLQYSSKTIYDKVVFDCWIDYVCRRDNVGNSALWNRFIRCKTPFEKIIFQRLCDFRYNRAVNEWLNIIRIQDYARTKAEFVFAEGIKSSREAVERRNYFDLMFSVTARELGCRLEDLGVTKFYSLCRTPGSPFMFPNISKEIIRHVLADFDYSDDYSDINDYTESADEIAMDAFSRMKAGLPPDLSEYKIPTGKMDNMPERIYMPYGLKAVIDLEIDSIIESGMWLAKCKRCGRYFANANDAVAEYCSRRSTPNGKTCLEIFEEENPRPKITDELLERCRIVTDEMYSRVDKTMSLKEYNSWYTYLEAMKQKVENGEIASSELESFLDYSREVDISKSNPIVEVAKKEPEAPKERVVKPFIPERISRSEIKQFESPDEPEEPAEPVAKPSREGFFTSPSVQRQKNERPQISHIIRNGEPLGGEKTSAPNPAGFRSFESQFRTTQPREPEQAVPQPEIKQRPIKKEGSASFENFKRLEERLEAERRLREERRTFKPFVETDRGEFVEDYPQTPPRREQPRPKYEQAHSEYEQPRPEYEEPRRRRPETQEPYYGYHEDTPRRTRSGYDRSDESYEQPTQRSARIGEFVEEKYQAPDFSAQSPSQHERPEAQERNNQYTYREQDKEHRQPSPQQPEQSLESQQAPPEQAERRPRVIRKNAAAISAYGKMAGKAVTTFNPTDAAPPSAEGADPGNHRKTAYEQPQQTRQPEQEAADYAESSIPQIDSEMLEPFKDIGSIFDVLEQSESNLNGSRRRTVYDEPYSSEASRPEERKPERNERYDYPEQNQYPSEPRPLRKEEVPGGIWTEDRGLFNEAPVSPQPPAEEYPIGEDLSERETEAPEPENTHDRRHTRSSKTQRLYDVIMREPDDNPNFRKK